VSLASVKLPETLKIKSAAIYKRLIDAGVLVRIGGRNYKRQSLVSSITSFRSFSISRLIFATEAEVLLSQVMRSAFSQRTSSIGTRYTSVSIQSQRAPSDCPECAVP
jgi:hypothetical protein